jgi:WD40 repeat protein
MPTPQLRPRLHGGAFTPIFACVAASLAASAAAQTRFSFETRGCVGATPIVFTADSGLLALAGNGADILLFDLVKRKEAAVLEHADEGQAPAGISHIALSPDSRTLAAVYSGDLSDREIVFFDVERRARRGTVPLKSGLTASAFFPDGSKFIAAVLNADAKRPMEVRVWDSASVEQIKSLDEAPSVASIAFSRDGKWLATVTVHGPA